MRKFLAAAGAAMLAASTFVPAASAQTSMGSGSCGPREGVYGRAGVTESETNPNGSTVPYIFYEVNYQGATPGQMMVAIIRYNDELESQVGLQPFTVPNVAGTAVGRFGPGPFPEETGGFNWTRLSNHGGSSGGGGLRSNKGGGQAWGSKAKTALSGAYTSAQRGGGLEPGEYVFYVYGASMEGGRVVANENQLVARFGCAVIEDKDA